jgi:hypothetical protein
MEIKDRIKELRRVPASELRANPKNWRTHPQTQREGLQAVLGRIGYADAVIARETGEGLELIDGHLRVEESEGAVVPVLIVDLNDQEADEVLATLDPLTLLAGRDTEQLKTLLQSLETDNGLGVLIQDISDTYNISLVELLEQPTAADFAELPQTWGGQEVTPNAVLASATGSGTTEGSLKAFMFYIELERYNELTEAVFRLGEKWSIDTVADVVYEAVRRADGTAN